MTLQKNYTPKIIYDDEADVLYLKYASNLNATGIEIGGNIIFYTDDSTHEPTTLTIMNFYWLEQKGKDWRKLLPIDIDFENDIYPNL